MSLTITQQNAIDNPSSTIEKEQFNKDLNECASYDVAYVEIPSSVIKQALKLDGATEFDVETKFQSQFSNSDLLNKLNDELIILDRKVDEQHDIITNNIENITKAQKLYTIAAAAAAIANLPSFSIPNIKLADGALRTLSESEKKTIGNINTSFAEVKSESPEVYKSRIELYSANIELASQTIANLNNNRINLQSKLIHEQMKLLKEIKLNPYQEPSGEEVLTKYYSGFRDMIANDFY